ncbi:MAG TPA: type II secretion system protein GspM [Noviherbaspirillum sp.]|jgi:general secretion pathway protein M|uniref:type II secretion system protein GspM n=1 Tax=Noviherbaspirillum sp. TaxID=1926288 RepID=UPI002DDC9240|nr:type II secretion system protein GspM [Noviherbaspirillum sp.]HEV2611157.1 type II secretion system protein GspM [Noviherbaspirillum sp.]
MRAPTALGGIKRSISTFWSERNQRERTMLSVAIAVIVAGLFYVLLIDPAISGRQDLEKKLPDMRRQAAELQALARETTALSGKSAGAAPAFTRENIEASLQRKGLKADNVAMTGELARVQLKSVSFASTVEWLEEIQRTARVSVVEANFEGLAAIDTVNAALTLRQLKGGQSQ